MRASERTPRTGTVRRVQTATASCGDDLAVVVELASVERLLETATLDDVFGLGEGKKAKFLACHMGDPASINPSGQDSVADVLSDFAPDASSSDDRRNLGRLLLA